MANVPRENNGLTKQQNEFVRQYVQNGAKQEAAALAAGYAKGGARSVAYQLLQREDIQNAIHRETMQAARAYGPLAIKVLVELAEHAKSATVRQQAAATLADRAGIKSNNIIEIHDLRSVEEIDKELAYLLGDGSDVGKIDISAELEGVKDDIH